MGTKKKSIKLSLKKSTIASLESVKMGHLKGGEMTPYCQTYWNTNCDKCTVIGTCDGCISAIPYKCGGTAYCYYTDYC